MASLPLLSPCGARSSADGEMGRTAQALPGVRPTLTASLPCPWCQAQRKDSVLRDEDQGPVRSLVASRFLEKKALPVTDSPYQAIWS